MRAVTPMSLSGRVEGGDRRGKYVRRLAESPVARPVHAVCLVVPVVAAAVVSVGCVIPPPLDVELLDAGVNSAPAIVNVTDATAQSLRPPATLTINRANTNPAPITVTTYDTDLGDQLELRFYVDYDEEQLPARLPCPVPAAAGESPMRTAICAGTNGLCTDEDVDGESHRLEIELYDRPPPETFPFRVLDTTSDALFSTWTLDLICVNDPL